MTSMTFKHLVLLATLLLALTSGARGGEDDTWGPSRDRASGGKPPPTAPDPAPKADEPARGLREANQSRGAGMLAPPAGAQWTIYCQTIAGPDHVGRANRYKEQLIQATGLNEWYVIHQDGQSTLYFGFYKSFDDPKDSESLRAQRDRKSVDGLTDRLGNRPFKFAFFVALDSPDPVAPPEWNLTNAVGAYSLQIAAYTGHPMRKQAAVDAVRAARTQGLEAFYFHGETTSSVCIGAWPEGAVKRSQEVANARLTGPDDPFIVTGVPLPDEAARNQRDSQGRPIRVEQEKFEIVDASLTAAMRQFPEHAVNGEVVVNTTVDASGRKVSRPASSFLVPIPRLADSPLSNGTAEPEVARPAAQQPPPEEPGRGRLRGVGP